MYLITCFPLVDISIRSGDIRDRGLKLSEIAPNFRRFALTNFRRADPKSCTSYHACLAARHVKKFREGTSPSPRVIGAHTR